MAKLQEAEVQEARGGKAGRVRYSFAKVARWIKEPDSFFASTDRILIPYHTHVGARAEGGSPLNHWVLLVVDLKMKRIEAYDPFRVQSAVSGRQVQGPYPGGDQLAIWGWRQACNVCRIGALRIATVVA
jgi:hypothetical protein